MHQHDSEVVAILFKNLKKSIEFLGELLTVAETDVPYLIRTKALLRRVRVSFLGLYEYLGTKSELPQEMHDKPLEEIADFFIKKECLSADDKDSFMMLASMYSAIRWPAPGSTPDSDKILKSLPETYTFLNRFISSGEPAGSGEKKDLEKRCC